MARFVLTVALCEDSEELSTTVAVGASHSKASHTLHKIHQEQKKEVRGAPCCCCRPRFGRQWYDIALFLRVVA